MRGRELWIANAAALVVGLVLHAVAGRWPAVPIAGLFLTGLAVVRTFHARRPVPGHPPRSLALRAFGLLLNAFYGSFFALLAYFVARAFGGAFPGPPG